MIRQLLHYLSNSVTAILFIAISLTLVVARHAPVHAANASDWHASNIIADSVFYDNNSMSISDIQNLLNSKVTNCDTNGTQSATDDGYPNLTHSQYAAQQGWPGPPYICLENYIQVPQSSSITDNYSASLTKIADSDTDATCSFNATKTAPAGQGCSSAQIIKAAADAYGVSPKVIIVTLQKESLNLLYDNWPLQNQYKNAMGYGCPDTAPCDPSYAGFYNQVNNAAWQWNYYKQHAYDKDSSGNYIYRHQPYNTSNVSYNPNSACGSSPVQMGDYATTALYNYTPYQPNQAAINNLYGSGDSCSAYGNRNFWRIYSDWFGNPQGGADYQWSPVSFSIYSDAALTNKIGDSASKVTLQPGQTAYVQVQAKNTGNNLWNAYTKFETTNPPVLGNSSWIAYNYPAQLNSSPISYGQVGTYNFSITAPSTTGSYYQSFNIVQNDTIWLNDPHVGINLDVVTPLAMPTNTDASQLKSTQSLELGQSISSPINHSTLRFENGQLNLYVNLKLAWSTNIPNSKAVHLVNQADGNLVLYDATWKPVWATGTDGRGSSYLCLQTDGNLVLYNASGATWASNTWAPSELSTVITSMGQNYTLFAGQSFISADRQYRLVLQYDGNLVLYNASNKPIWATGTDGKGGDRLVLQYDGNLVLYTPSGKPVWATGTDGSGSTNLFFQADRNIVLYNNHTPTWASNTAGY